MTIRYGIEMDDLLAFQRDYHAASRRFKRRAVILGALYFLLGAFLLCYAVYLYRNGTPLSDLGLLVIFALGLVSLLFGAFIRKRLMSTMLNQARKAYSQPGNAGYFDPAQMELDEKGIKIIRQDKESKFKWDTIVKVKQTPEHFFVYVSDMAAQIIPKRELTSEEITELDKLFNRYVTKDRITQ